MARKPPQSFLPDRALSEKKLFPSKPKALPSVSKTRSVVVGLSKKGFLALSLLMLAGFGNNLYQKQRQANLRLAELEKMNRGLLNSLEQKEALLDSQNRLIERYEQSQGVESAKGASIRVVNNFNLPERSAAKTKVSSSGKPETLGSKRYYATESLIMPKFEIAQLPLSAYVEEVRPEEVRDYRELLYQVQVQKNRFQRHQSADRDKFAKFRDITGTDRLEWHRFTERQTADRHELNRMFDKITDGHRRRRRVGFYSGPR